MVVMSQAVSGSMSRCATAPLARGPMSNKIRSLRGLNRLDGMNHLLPETGPSPLDLLKLGGKERQRASGQRARQTNEKWSWGDDP